MKRRNFIFYAEIESTRIDKCVHAVPLSDTPVRTYVRTLRFADSVDRFQIIMR